MTKKKILVVDDERGFTEMLKLNLETTGKYEVVIENDSSNAFKTAIAFNPDLIFMDIIMPKMEGPDVVCQFRNNAELKNIPIVFLTATVRHDEVEGENGIVAGYQFLAKPCSMVELVDCIEKHLP